jgi:hypothetical protein
MNESYDEMVRQRIRPLDRVFKALKKEGTCIGVLKQNALHSYAKQEKKLQEFIDEISEGLKNEGKCKDAKQLIKSFEFYSETVKRKGNCLILTDILEAKTINDDYANFVKAIKAVSKELAKKSKYLLIKDFNFENILQKCDELKNNKAAIDFLKQQIINVKRLEIEANEAGYQHDNKSFLKLLNLEIERRKIFLKQEKEDFKPQGYSMPICMKDLCKKIPVCQRKLFRFISSESIKQTPLIKKIRKGVYCIRNNCESKIKESLKY